VTVNKTSFLEVSDFVREGKEISKERNQQPRGEGGIGVLCQDG